MRGRGVARGPFIVLTRAVVVVLLGSSLSSCSADGDSEPAVSAQPQLALAVTQLLPRQGTRQVLLRVSNGSADPLTITGVGIRWGGYGGRFLRTEEAEVPAVSYGDRWVLDRDRMVLDGHLEVERLTTGDPVTFTRAIGSVLHRVELPRPALVPAHGGHGPWVRPTP